MIRSLVLLMLAGMATHTVLAQQSTPPTPSPQAVADARAACAADVQSLCPGVPAGGGKILACLKQHKDDVSPGCKQAVMKALGGANAAPSPASAPPVAAPATSSTAAPMPAAPMPAAHAHAPTAPGAAGAANYIVMKKVQVIDKSQPPERPAYTLLIPATWDFTGVVKSGVADGGCFADFFSALADAKSPDGTMMFQMLPSFTWQYIDDPGAQRQIQQENQEGKKFGLKPCPLLAPVHAEQFLRQEMIAKHLQGRTVVSVEPFPELEQLARHQLGLPPSAAGGTQGIRTEAARARLTFNDDTGKPMEQWITAVIVVRTLSGAGRSASYDWHAVNVMNFRTPKGQLDANEKLFKFIASSVHPDPAWQQYSNGVIAHLYQAKQQEEAKRSAIVAQLQRQVIDTINGVVANQQQGSFASANAADQNIRGVQTFRDPSSGATFELSNQYDHAWLNGANEYVMSDDPNFNPNGNLSGSWTTLQAVRP